MKSRRLLAALTIWLATLAACGGGGASSSPTGPPPPPPPPPPPQLTITPNPLPGGIAGVPYLITFSAQGGTPPYVWDSGSTPLPQGFSLSSSGVLSGTSPLAAGGVPGQKITIHVLDSSSPQHFG